MRGSAKQRLHPGGPETDASSVFPGPTREQCAPLDGLRVLVVDDHREELERFAAWLALAGAEVVCARTLAGAQRAVDQTSFDVLVLDRLLPDGDPIEALVQPARRSEPARAHVVMSGFIDARSWEAIERAGAVPAPKSQVRTPLILAGFVEEACRRAGVALASRAAPGDGSSLASVAMETGKRIADVDERWIVRRNPVAVDVAWRRVEVLGKRARLQAKQFDVLLHLMLHAERIVTERELLDTLWSESTHDKDASHVRATISRLRAALGLPGDAFIQTAPGGWGIGIWHLVRGGGGGGGARP